MKLKILTITGQTEGAILCSYTHNKEEYIVTITTEAITLLNPDNEDLNIILKQNISTFDYICKTKFNNQNININSLDMVKYFRNLL